MFLERVFFRDSIERKIFFLKAVYISFQRLMSIKSKFPDVYILSTLKNLHSELKTYLPSNVRIIQIPVKDEKQVICGTDIDALKDAEVLVTDGPFIIQLLYSLPNVKWIQNSWAGVESIIKVLDYSKPFPSFLLTRYSDEYFGELMANFVMASIINIERSFYCYHDQQKSREWKKPDKEFCCRVLSDLAIGILGAGNLGRAVGQSLKKCRSWVLAFVRNPREGPSEEYDKCYTDLNSVLEQCDYFVNLLPSTEKTQGLLDNDVLSICKKKPVFINIGRGDIIKETTLVKAIQEKWISGAVLDVFEKEPLPEESALWTTPEVHITPHIAAITTSHGLAKFTAENYLRFIQGEKLKNTVDWFSGY